MVQRIEERITEKLSKIKIKDVMTRSVITTTTDEPLSDLADILIKTKISGVPVVTGDKKILGIITATDFLNLMDKIKQGAFGTLKEGKGINPKVHHVMTRNVTAITETHTLLDVVNIMCEKEIHTLPVVREEKLIGVIGRRDVIMYFYAAVRDAIEELKL